MQKRILPALFAASFLILFIGFGCTKIDTTTLGNDLVTVDNVNTFADTLQSISATTGIFNDSTVVNKADNQVIGLLTTDPLFGQTDARIYAQFKPTFYPFYFGNAGDKVYTSQSPDAGFDSAFVCLSFKGGWGDTSSNAIGQTFEVRQIVDDAFRLNTDTLRKLNYTPPTVNSTLLGSTTITPTIVKQQVILARGRDSVSNQIRIKLTGPGQNFASAIFNGQDSTTIGPNNGFYKDSIFRKNLNGFEIRVSNTSTGNTLYYINLAEAKSRFEFHFHKVSSTGVKDTVVQSFQFYTASIGTTTGVIAASSGTDYVKRTYTGSPLAAPSADQVYLQNSPGTYASLQIPGLTNYSNRIIHRAYLIVEQTPFDLATDQIYSPPPYLYLDLKDTVISTPQVYKPVYFDLSTTYNYNPDATVPNALYHPYPLSNVDISNFDGRLRQRYEGGVPYARYEINITRYVQHIVSNGYHNYDLRLYAPYSYFYPQYTGVPYVIPYYNPLAFGRVRVGSGTINSPHRMKLVVIYSKI